MKHSSIVLLGAAMLGAGAPAHAQWQSLNEGGTCTQVILPDAGSPTMVGITGDGSPMAMITFASKAMPQLGPGANYQGLMRFDDGEAKSVAIVQRPDAETVMVAMMMPLDHLDVLAQSQAIHVRLDGRRLTEVAPPGRAEAVAALRECVAKLPEKRGGQGAGTAAPPRPAAPGPQPRRSTDDALAAAAAAGDRVAGNEPRSAPRQSAQAPGAYPQAEPKLAARRYLHARHPPRHRISAGCGAITKLPDPLRRQRFRAVHARRAWAGGRLYGALHGADAGMSPDRI